MYRCPLLTTDQFCQFRHFHACGICSVIGSTRCHIQFCHLYFSDNSCKRSRCPLKFICTRTFLRLVMPLHSHSVNPCPLCILYILKKLYDSVYFHIVPLVIIIVIQFYIWRRIPVCKHKCVTDIFRTPVNCPPAWIFCITAVSTRIVTDRFIHYIPAIKKFSVFAVFTGKMFQNGLYVPFLTPCHRIFIYIVPGFIIILMEKPLRCLGMPHQHMPSDPDKIIRMFLVPL